MLEEVRDRLIAWSGGKTNTEIISELRQEFKDELENIEVKAATNNVSVREAAMSNMFQQLAFDLGTELTIGGKKYAPNGVMETSGAEQQVTQDELFACWDKNALGGTIVDFYSIYPLGDGPTWNMPDTPEWENIDNIIRQMWDENGIDIKQYKWGTALSLNGEIFLRMFGSRVDDEDSESPIRVWVRNLNPATIVRVITDPEDAEIPLYYHQRYFISIPPDTLLPFPDEFPTTEWLQSQDGFRNVVDMELADENGYIYPVSEVTGYAKTKGEKLYDPSVGFFAWITRKIDAKEIIHVKVNSLDWETRGRSDLYRVVRWIKEYQSLLSSLTRLAKMATLFLWDVSVQGGQNSVNAVIAANLAPPPPGGIKVHPDTETWQIMNPQINSGDFSSVISAILNMISGGTKLASFMLGNGSDISFASSDAQFLPVVKSFQLRQNILKQMFRDILKKTIAINQYYGSIPKLVPEVGMDGKPTGRDINPIYGDFGLRLPDVAEIDMLEKATALGQLADRQMVSKSEVQEQMGLNPDEQKVELDKENEDDQDSKIDAAKKFQDAGFAPPQGTPGPTPTDPNIIKQGGGTPPRVGPSAGGQGSNYPNHQKSADTTNPRRRQTSR